MFNKIYMYMYIYLLFVFLQVKDATTSDYGRHLQIVLTACQLLLSLMTKSSAVTEVNVLPFYADEKLG